MDERHKEFLAVLPAILLMGVFCATGLFAFAFLSLAGATAIQAGMHGFRETGYLFGTHRITGTAARSLGFVAIAGGAGVIVVLVAISFGLGR